MIVGAARTSGKSLNTWILDAISNEMHRADARTGDFAWTIEETAMEAFQVFLQEISLHWVDSGRGQNRTPRGKAPVERATDGPLANGAALLRHYTLSDDDISGRSGRGA